MSRTVFNLRGEDSGGEDDQPLRCWICAETWNPETLQWPRLTLLDEGRKYSVCSVCKPIFVVAYPTLAFTGSIQWVAVFGCCAGCSQPTSAFSAWLVFDTRPQVPRKTDVWWPASDPNYPGPSGRFVFCEGCAQEFERLRDTARSVRVELVS